MTSFRWVIPPAVRNAFAPIASRGPFALVHTGIDVAVGGKNVLPTIVVVVEKSRAAGKKRNRGGSDAGLKADVGKISITLVAIKGIVIVGERRHVEREVSAIFVIAD